MMNSLVLINPSMYRIRSLENLLAVKKSVIVSFLDRIMVRVHSPLDLSTDAIHAHTRARPIVADSCGREGLSPSVINQREHFVTT